MRGSIVVLVVAVVVVGSTAFDPPTNPLDEFLPLVGAQRLLAGEVPYRDFTTLYPPLTTMLDAALLALAPASVLLARAVFGAIVVGGVLLVKSIATRLAASERAGTLVGLLAACSQAAPPWGYALVVATVLVLASIACALREGRGWTVAAGALLGLAALARLDAAAYGALPVALALAGRTRGELLLAGLFAALPVVVLGAALAVLGAGRAAFEQLFVIPATLYPAIRGLPWPLPWRAPGDAPLSPALGSIYGPAIVSVLALAHAALTRKSRRHFAVAALPLCLGLTAVVRPDRAHACGAALASFAAIGVLSDAPWTAIGLVLALTLPPAAVSVSEAARLARHVLSPRSTWAEWPTRRGLLDHGGVDDQRRGALEAIAEARASHERIYVALPRHDRIWINDVSFYFDAQLLPASRHHELYALVATTREVQTQIVADLERARPRFVVISRVPLAFEPNASARSGGARVLDDYLASAYRVVFASTRYRVLRRV